ncbi:MAG: hypothetical protein JO215_06090 [Ktedonobacteraceae bacterium]|nr:hypothetical protein [Ktedonobacteraceae bacterium]MBV9614527.1 hypothetical protein [Ktedonobacteraceae bacterium]
MRRDVAIGLIPRARHRPGLDSEASGCTENGEETLDGDAPGMVYPYYGKVLAWLFLW